MNVFNKIVHGKKIIIKKYNKDWFDREVSNLIHVLEKLFIKFKKSKLRIDEEIYKKVRNHVQNHIKKVAKFL